MPLLTRTYLKTSLVYFFLALVLALLLASGQVANLPESIAVLRPIYLHLFVVGWISQIIFGMMYWMLPRFGGDRSKRGKDAWAWVAIIALNLGVVSVMVAPFTWFAHQLTLFGRFVEAMAALIFVIYAWPRIKAWGK